MGKKIPKINIENNKISIENYRNFIWHKDGGVDKNYDVQKFDLQKCLTYLNSYAFNPNGENLEYIKKYNQIMIDLYQGKKITSIEDNYKMWLALRVNKKDGLEIKGLIQQYKYWKEIAQPKTYEPLKYRKLK